MNTLIKPPCTNDRPEDKIVDQRLVSIAELESRKSIPQSR